MESIKEFLNWITALVSQSREAKFTGRTIIDISWSQGGIAKVELDTKKTIK